MFNPPYFIFPFSTFFLSFFLPFFLSFFLPFFLSSILHFFHIFFLTSISWPLPWAIILPPNQKSSFLPSSNLTPSLHPILDPYMVVCPKFGHPVGNLPAKFKSKLWNGKLKKKNVNRLLQNSELRAGCPNLGHTTFPWGRPLNVSALLPTWPHYGFPPSVYQRKRGKVNQEITISAPRSFPLTQRR